MAALCLAVRPRGSSSGDAPVVDEGHRRRAVAALRERAPGRLREARAPGAWAALTGAHGEMVDRGGHLLLVDGVPRTPAGAGAEALLDHLRRQGVAPSGEAGPAPGPEALRSALADVTGFFAACYLHGPTGRILLLRDRVGSRPLFHARDDDRVLVASECAVLQGLGLDLSLDRSVLPEALAYRWVTGERCLLAPAARVDRAGATLLEAGSPPESVRTWRLELDPEPLREGDRARYLDALDRTLRSAIRRLAGGATRPGLLLSGGVDSSILAALMKEELGSCVAFSGHIPGFDNRELERAEMVARHLDLDFRPVEIDPGAFGRDLRTIVRRLEELPRHANNLVLLQLYRRAGEEVDVLLQGDAADTLFGLRTRRRMASFQRKRRLVGWLPEAVLRAAARILEPMPHPRAWPAAGVLAWEVADLIRTHDAIMYAPELRLGLGLSHLERDAWVSGDWDPALPPDLSRRLNLLSTGIQGSLIRHDRLSRPQGLDSLPPFLTPEVLELATRMPVALREDVPTKPLLRDLCDRYLPDRVSRWSKIGFDIPREEWIFGVLLPLCREAREALAGRGLLPPGFVEAALERPDVEAAFSTVSLHLLLETFGIDPAGTGGGGGPANGGGID